MSVKRKKISLAEFKARAGNAHIEMISRVLMATVATNLSSMSNADKTRVLLRLAGEIHARLETLEIETDA